MYIRQDILNEIKESDSTRLSLPDVLERIWTALVIQGSSVSANHTGGVEGYVS